VRSDDPHADTIANPAAATAVFAKKSRRLWMFGPVGCCLFSFINSPLSFLSSELFVGLDFRGSDIKVSGRSSLRSGQSSRNFRWGVIMAIKEISMHL